MPWRLPAALLLPLALLTLGGCNGEGEDTETAERGAPPPAVVIVEDLRSGSEIAHDILLPGRVEAVTQAEVSFLAEGRLEAIFVAEGERVAAGQEIASIDDTDYQVELRQAITTEQTAASDLARRRVLNRDGILARAAVEEAEANLAQTRAQREAAERQVSHTTLQAPYAGQIGRRVAEVGTVVGAGEPIVTMVDGEAVDVVVDVPAAEAVRLPFGSQLEGVGLLQGVGAEIEMPLAYAEHSTVPDEQSRTYRLVLRGLPPPEFNVLPGMAVRVQLNDPAPRTMPPGELLVPISAVLSLPDGRSAVFVATEEQTVRQLPVEIVEIQGERALVRGELGERALVVVAGGQHLSDGQAIRPSVRD